MLKRELIAQVDRLNRENDMLLQEIMKLKNIQKGKNRWIKIFIFLGMVMFVGGIFQTIYSMFYIGMDVIPMTRLQIWFSIIGFVFVAANDELAGFANTIGKIVIEKFNKFFK